MLELLQNELGVFSTSIGIFITINSIFYKMDDFFSKEFKDDVAIRLLCINDIETNVTRVNIFIKIFDLFYKKNIGNLSPDIHCKNYLSWHTFFRSSISSIISVGIVASVGFTVGPFLSSYFRWDFVIFIFTVSLIINLIPDYISLLETRYILEKINSRRSNLKKIMMIIIDFFLSVLIYFIYMLLFFLITNIFRYGFLGIFDERVFLEAINELSRGFLAILWLEREIDYNMFGIFVYTTIFPSLWLWLFLVSNAIISLASKTKLSLAILKYILPIETTPFRSIGVVCALTASLFYMSFAIFK